MSQSDLLSIVPILALVIGACLVVVSDLIRPLGSRSAVAMGSVAAVVAAIGAVALGPGEPGFGGGIQRDAPALLFTALIGIVTASALLLGVRYIEREALPPAETVALVLFSAAGAALMTAGGDLLIIFLGLELLSLPLYALTGFLKRSELAAEGALKYFLLGAAASAVLLYGIALLYAATGSIRLEGLGSLGGNSLYLAGLALLIAGLAFKAALVPFHAWAPDAYAAAPTIVTAFMAVVAKVGAFAALLRIAFAVGDGSVAGDWQVTLATLAAATLVLANLSALGQRKLKRLLAYSSIAHAGYIAIGLGAGAIAGPAVLFYLSVYALLTVAAFGIVTLLDDDDPTIESLGGLWRERPLLTVALAVVLFGLTGLPPTAGFVAKLFIFQVAIEANLLWLVLLGVLASVVSAAYYLRVLLACMAPSATTPPVSNTAGRSRTGALVVGVAVAAVVIVGVVPGPLLGVAERAVYGEVPALDAPSR